MRIKDALDFFILFFIIIVSINKVVAALVYIQEMRQRCWFITLLAGKHRLRLADHRHRRVEQSAPVAPPKRSPGQVPHLPVSGPVAAKRSDSNQHRFEGGGLSLSLCRRLRLRLVLRRLGLEGRLNEDQTFRQRRRGTVLGQTAAVDIQIQCKALHKERQMDNLHVATAERLSMPRCVSVSIEVNSPTENCQEEIHQRKCRKNVLI